MDAPHTPAEAAHDLGRVHLIHIGGSTMSNLARLLLGRGIRVTGSDPRDSATTRLLRALGITVYPDYSAEHLQGVDTVVRPSVFDANNPELREAHQRGLRVLSRPEALVAATRTLHLITVVGNEDKTSIASMMTVVLQHCGADPSFVVDGRTHSGTGEYFVVETGENDTAFPLYQPHVAILTSIEADQAGPGKKSRQIPRTVIDLINRIRPSGSLIACADDPVAVALTRQARKQGRAIHTYGHAEGATLRITEEIATPRGNSYLAVQDGQPLGVVGLVAPGSDIALNSAGALLTAITLGLPASEAIRALSSFAGVRRQFELKGVVNNVRVYDDYAYQPPVIASHLRTARQLVGKGRLILVFQPYQLARTTASLDVLGTALANADEVIVMEVHAPGEERLPGQGGFALARAIPLPPDQVHFEYSWSATAPAVTQRAHPGDLVLTMGAPQAALMAEEILAELAQSAT